MLNSYENCYIILIIEDGFYLRKSTSICHCGSICGSLCEQYFMLENYRIMTNTIRRRYNIKALN